MDIFFIENAKRSFSFSSLMGFSKEFWSYRDSIINSLDFGNPLINYLDFIRTALRDYDAIPRRHGLEDFYNTTITLYRTYGDLRANYIKAFKTLYKEYEERESSLSFKVNKFQAKKPEDYDRDDDVELQYQVSWLAALILKMRETAKNAKEAYENYEGRYILVQVLLKGLDVLKTMTLHDQFKDAQKEVEDIVQKSSAIWDNYCKNVLGKRVLDINI